MIDTKTEPAIINSTVQTFRNPDFKDIYSNHNRIGVSPVDFNIVFSRIIEPALGMNAIEDQAVIRMSAQQFKSFLESANRTMAAWEEVFGGITETIRSPPQEAMVRAIRRLKETIDSANS